MSEERDIFEICGKFYAYKPGPHLIGSCDWHNAMIPIIEELTTSSGTISRPTEIPAYPLCFPRSPGLLFELGSYWEGAIYFLHEKIGSRDLLDSIKQLEVNRNSLSCLEEIFLRTWNSNGQLKWLKAHLIRDKFLSGSDINHEAHIEISRYAKIAMNYDLQWLAQFVEQHREEGLSYPNPYFGGTNPLHLGLVDLS